MGLYPVELPVLDLVNLLLLLMLLGLMAERGEISAAWHNEIMPSYTQVAQQNTLESNTGTRVQRVCTLPVIMWLHRQHVLHMTVS